LKSRIVLSFFEQSKCMRSYKLCSYKKKSVGLRGGPNKNTENDNTKKSCPRDTITQT